MFILLRYKMIIIVIVNVSELSSGIEICKKLSA